MSQNRWGYIYDCLLLLYRPICYYIIVSSVIFLSFDVCTSESKIRVFACIIWGTSKCRVALCPALWFIEFLARDSIYAVHTIGYPPSVCPSHGWISQKRLKLGSCNFHNRVAQSPSFCSVSLIQKFWRVPPKRGRQTRVGWRKQAIF